MSGQSANEPKSKIAACLNNLDMSKAKSTGSGGKPHGADHYEGGKKK